LQKEETANRKQLLARHGSEHIIDTISAHFKVSRDDVFAGSRGYRNLSIYLIKRFTGMTNGQIGELFGDISLRREVYVRYLLWLIKANACPFIALDVANMPSKWSYSC
jgi:hypothetical protein